MYKFVPMKPATKSKDMAQSHTESHVGPIALTASDPKFLASLGHRVREAREQRGWARKVLSRTADVSERYLAQLEAGEGHVGKNEV